MIIGSVLKIAERVYGEVKDRQRKSEADLRHHKITATVEGLSTELEALRQRCLELNDADVQQTQLIKDSLEEIAGQQQAVANKWSNQRSLAIVAIIISLVAIGLSIFALVSIHGK
jgi:DNA repair exonuclease SbcCD ATPase subunit